MKLYEIKLTSFGPTYTVTEFEGEIISEHFYRKNGHNSRHAIKSSYSEVCTAEQVVDRKRELIKNRLSEINREVLNLENQETKLIKVLEKLSLDNLNGK